MNTATKENRASEEYARNVFESLYDSNSIQIACARLLADSILVAHQAGSSSWSLTLFPDKIRLNVGPVEVLVLRSDEVFLVVADSNSNYLDNSDYRNFVTPSEMHYPSVRINHRRCFVPPQTIAEFYPLIAENHHRLIQVAAKRRRRTAWESSFSLGAIHYLNNLLKISLPAPAYLSFEAERLTALQEIEQFKDSYEGLQETTRESVVQSRIGQGQFRTSLIDYWQGCSVSGCKQIELLRASHIKPWRHSSNAERLDRYNGLLLLPNLDACFDLGLISFDDEGKILISRKLNEPILSQLGINSNLKILRIEQKHKDFLRFHRENVFCH